MFVVLTCTAGGVIAAKLKEKRKKERHKGKKATTKKTDETTRTPLVNLQLKIYGVLRVATLILAYLYKKR